MGRIWRIPACRAGGKQRGAGRTGIADVSVPKVAPLPVQSVTAAHVLSPDPAAPASLWQWLGRLPGPRDPRGLRFTLPCVIAISIAARLAGCDSFTAAGEWAASRPQRVLKALGCPRHKRAGIRVAPSEKTIRRVAGLIDHDLADDLLCGHAAELAAAGEVLSPAQLQEQRRGEARKAKARARKARDRARKAAKRARAARGRAQKQARNAARQARKAAAAAAAASAAAVAGGRAKLPAGSAFGRVRVPAGHPAFPAGTCGDPRHLPALRGLGADGKASRGARLTGQEAPQHLGFFWHGTRLNAAQRGVDRKTNETTVIGPVIDGMDLAGVCLTVDALHSLVDLNERVLALCVPRIPVHGSDQQDCRPSRLTVMITDHVPAVRLPPDHADGVLAAAVPTRGDVADRRDLDPAPPARRPATAAAVPPRPEPGGPGTARGFAQRDTESAAPGTAAAGHPGHHVALAPGHRPPPLGRQIHARQARPPGDPPEHQGPGPPAGPGEPRMGGTAGFTVNWPAWE
jgi:hypothetical protein